MAKKESIFKKYGPYIKNKYALTFLGFLIWLSFFDRNDFLTTYSYRSKLHDLRKEKIYYEEEIKNNTARLNDLLNNYENLERYGREKYFMKKKNEDVFLIVNKNVAG